MGRWSVRRCRRAGATASRACRCGRAWSSGRAARARGCCSRTTRARPRWRPGSTPSSSRAAAALLGGVSPGLAAFPTVLGGDPEGLLAPVQWHADLPGAPQLGPSSAELAAEARASGLGELDYVAAQAHAAALVAAHCLELDPDDPLAAARRLRTRSVLRRLRARPGGAPARPPPRSRPLAREL